MPFARRIILGNFEPGEPWVLIDPTGTEVTFDTVIKYAGTRSLKIVAIDGLGYAWGAYRDFAPALDLRDYHGVSIWMRPADTVSEQQLRDGIGAGGSSAALILTLIDTSDRQLRFLGDPPEPVREADWREIFFRFNAFSDGDPTIDFGAIRFFEFDLVGGFFGTVTLNIDGPGFSQVGIGGTGEGFVRITPLDGPPQEIDFSTLTATGGPISLSIAYTPETTRRTLAGRRQMEARYGVRAEARLGFSVEQIAEESLIADLITALSTGEARVELSFDRGVSFREVQLASDYARPPLAGKAVGVETELVFRQIEILPEIPPLAGPGW